MFQDDGKWEFNDAVRLLRSLKPHTREFGYWGCLGGAVLWNGSDPDGVDLFFVPVDEKGGDAEGLIAFLVNQWGQPDIQNANAESREDAPDVDGYPDGEFYVLVDGEYKRVELEDFNDAPVYNRVFVEEGRQRPLPFYGEACDDDPPMILRLGFGGRNPAPPAVKGWKNPHRATEWKAALTQNKPGLFRVELKFTRGNDVIFASVLKGSPTEDPVKLKSDEPSGDLVNLVKALGDWEPYDNLVGNAGQNVIIGNNPGQENVAVAPAPRPRPQPIPINQYQAGNVMYNRDRANGPDIVNG